MFWTQIKPPFALIGPEWIPVGQKFGTIMASRFLTFIFALVILYVLFYPGESYCNTDFTWFDTRHMGVSEIHLITAYYQSLDSMIYVCGPPHFQDHVMDLIKVQDISVQCILMIMIQAYLIRQQKVHNARRESKLQCMVTKWIWVK